MKAFRYPMDPILRQHAWEIDALRLELLTLNQALEAHLGALDGLGRAIAAAAQEILDSCRAQATIERGRKEIAEAWLRDQRRLALEKEGEIAQVRALAENVFAQITRKQQSQRVIEKHRARLKAEFEAEALRLEALEIDELWLARVAAAA